MSDCEKRIEIMEKEILYYTGMKRFFAKQDYLNLIKECSKEIGLSDPIFIKRK